MWKIQMVMGSISKGDSYLDNVIFIYVLDSRGNLSRRDLK